MKHECSVHSTMYLHGAAYGVEGLSVPVLDWRSASSESWMELGPTNLGKAALVTQGHYCRCCVRG